jgi:hypothetical protein
MVSASSTFWLEHTSVNHLEAYICLNIVWWTLVLPVALKIELHFVFKLDRFRNTCLC